MNQQVLEETPDRCNVCKKELHLETDRNKPRWQWSLESGSLLCKGCYDRMEADHQKRINYCASCYKKLGFIRYNPKPSWHVEGQLCRECWDKRNGAR